MKVLLLGSGGREHALAWRMAESDQCNELYCAPGNPGIAEVAECVDIGVNDFDALLAFVKDKAIDFVVVGPEDPLCAGAVDMFIDANIPVFGPKKNAAIMEGSKAFMKDFCAQYKIPTAAYGRFTDVAGAKAFIDKQGAPIVVKTDGLAAGKGVLICETVEDAYKAVETMLCGDAFGDAGKEIIIEEFMDGEELSFFAIADGQTVIPLVSAQDHKRAFDGDKGLNTGGMGAYSPAHMMTPELTQTIMDTIINPTIAGMKAEGRDYTGVLFAGLMIVDGVPKLIEYNIRFGDPECQVIMPRLKNDLLDVLYAAATGELHRYNDGLEWAFNTVLTVVMAAKGYPESYQKGTLIQNVVEAGNSEGVKIFHAGTKLGENGELLSNGGRVLNVTAGSQNVQEARDLAYAAIEKIDWPDGFYRSDIAHHALKAKANKAA